VIPVINTGLPILFFSNALSISYGYSLEYSPPGGNDTTYVVQGTDTLDLGLKASGLLFYDILDLKPDNIYSLFLTGADTNSPDYLLTTDTIPFYGPTDSTVGIRFVNLSAGSSPMTVNLEGSGIGSEANNLAYKSVTGFKGYACNSTVQSYEFVFRDAATGDSLAVYSLDQNQGYGLIDPFTNILLTFKSATIAIYGSEAGGSAYPLQTVLIDNY
jgi:hypothetical protein